MSTYLKIAITSLVALSFAGPASAQSARDRADRQLALSEATQTVQRFFTCVAEGVNAGSDTARTERAVACFRENYDEDGRLLFNGIELPGINALLDTFTGEGLGAQQFENALFNVDSVVDQGFTPRRRLEPARIQLRVNVLTTFLNEVPQSPALPLPLGEFAASFIEEFTLQEVRAGQWIVVNLEAAPIAAQPLPDGTILTPFPETASVLRTR